MTTDVLVMDGKGGATWMSISDLIVKKWMSIETAPKDGRDIIISDKTGHVRTTHWCKCDIYKDYHYHIVEAWFDYDDDGIIRALIEEEEPTHWMPMPKPPKCG